MAAKLSIEDMMDGFEMDVAEKPVNGVTVVEIPEFLVKVLEVKAPLALKDPEKYELNLKGKTPAIAQQLALYARAWGAKQEPKLRITKIANRKDMPDNVARLSVVLDDSVPAENRPGRRRSGLPH